MRKLLESTASRIIAEAQRIGVYVDPGVLSWPGGYIIAVSVYLYARAVVFTRGFIERRSGLTRRPCEECCGYPLKSSSKKQQREPIPFTRILLAGQLVSVTTMA